MKVPDIPKCVPCLDPFFLAVTGDWDAADAASEHARKAMSVSNAAWRSAKDACRLLAQDMQWFFLSSPPYGADNDDRDDMMADMFCSCMIASMFAGISRRARRMLRWAKTFAWLTGSRTASDRVRMSCSLLSATATAMFSEAEDKAAAKACVTESAYQAAMIGRCCSAFANGKQEIDRRISGFESACRAIGFIGMKSPFRSDHERLTYFLSSTASADEFKPRNEMIMMCGIPASGKDAWLQKSGIDSSRIVSFDDFRRDERNRRLDRSRLILSARRRIRDAALSSDDPYALNGTNISAKARMQWAREVVKYGSSVRIVYIDVSPQDAIDRARKRRLESGNSTGAGRDAGNVAWTSYLDIDPPTLAECHSMERIEG